MDESLTFCSRYTNTMDTKFNKIPRDDDFIDSSHSDLSIFKRGGQTKGSSKQLHLTMTEFNAR